MDKIPRWVYINGLHAIGIGMPHYRQGQYTGAFAVVILPDWMSQGFIDSLSSDLINMMPWVYIEVLALEDTLTMGEPVKVFERADTTEPVWYSRGSDPYYSRFQPPSQERMMNIRILLDGVLIWGKEKYPGERKIVVPRVKLPKKLRAGIPALEGGEVKS